jgi:hypothetical protein
MRVDFNRCHLGAGAREPDCGIATQCANLEHGCGVDEAALDTRYWPWRGEMVMAGRLLAAELVRAWLSFGFGFRRLCVLGRRFCLLGGVCRWRWSF